MLTILILVVLGVAGYFLFFRKKTSANYQPSDFPAPTPTSDPVPVVEPKPDETQKLAAEKPAPKPRKKP